MKCVDLEKSKQFQKFSLLLLWENLAIRKIVHLNFDNRAVCKNVSVSERNFANLQLDLILFMHLSASCGQCEYFFLNAVYFKE